MSRVGKGTAGGLRILQDLGLYSLSDTTSTTTQYTYYTYYNKDIKPKYNKNVQP